MSNSKSKIFEQVEEHVERGKYEEAIQILNRLQSTTNFTSLEQLSWELLKSTCLNRLGRDEEAIKLAKKVYLGSKELNEDVYSTDVSIVMAESLSWLGKQEKALKVISKAENLFKSIKNLSEKEYTRRKAGIFYVKAVIFARKGDLDASIELIKQSIALGEKFSTNSDKARSLYVYGHSLAFKGEVTLALETLDQSLSLEKNGFNRNITRIYLSMGAAYVFKGDLDRALNCYNQSLSLAKKMNDIVDLASLLNNIGMVFHKKGKLDDAQNNLRQSLVFLEELNSISIIPLVLDSLFHVSLDMGDLEQARQCLGRIKDIKDQEENQTTNDIYLLNSAILLKTNPRAHNIAKAEDILKEIVKTGRAYETTRDALLHLCDLLLIELRYTDNLEIIDELQPFVNQMLDLGEKNNSYILLVETYLLQAKIALLIFDLKKARRLLTQSQQIAERWGFHQLHLKISNELNDLNTQESLWKKIEEKDAPFTERMTLARIEDQIGGMLRNRMSLVAQITEEKVSVHKERKICLVCRGEVERFNIYICPDCSIIYCQNCARALTELENICWACNSPIDPTKPKKLEDKEKELKVSSEKDGKSTK